MPHYRPALPQSTRRHLWAASTASASSASAGSGAQAGAGAGDAVTAAGKAVAAGKLRVTWLDAHTQPAFCGHHFPRSAAAATAAAAGEPTAGGGGNGGGGGEASASRGGAQSVGYASPCADSWWSEAGEKVLRRSSHRPVYLLAYKPVGKCGCVRGRVAASSPRG